MNQHNEEKLQEIFKTIFENASDVTRLRRLAESTWDSLANTSLLAAIESEFNIELDIDDMERMSSYAAVKLLLEEKGL